jgi:transcriptional regulator with XRE-family HTH domain
VLDLIENDAHSLAEQFGDTIRKIRQEEGLSQGDLAERLGITRSAISKLEHGTRRITLDRFSRVLDELGYKADLSINKEKRDTNLDWGPIQSDDPVLRRFIRKVRKIAEQISVILYDEFSVDDIFVFGSLIEDGASKFRENSDLDLLVEGLDEEELFEAESQIEDEARSLLDEDEYLNIDLVRAESFPLSPDEIPTKYLPPSDQSS